jgi:hypothetical protein
VHLIPAVLGVSHIWPSELEVSTDAHQGQARWRHDARTRLYSIGLGHRSADAIRLDHEVALLLRVIDAVRKAGEGRVEFEKYVQITILFVADHRDRPRDGDAVLDANQPSRVVGELLERGVTTRGGRWYIGDI